MGWTRTATTWCLLVLLMGCGPSGAVVGDPCRDDYDCAERCLGGRDFPDGTCTVRCRDDRDCPGGTWCIDTQGGVCLEGCRDAYDCRRGYRCRDRHREGAGGKMDVCIGDR